jgi:hypothetical protein
MNMKEKKRGRRSKGVTTYNKQKLHHNSVVQNIKHCGQALSK